VTLAGVIANTDNMALARHAAGVQWAIAGQKAVEGFELLLARFQREGEAGVSLEDGLLPLMAIRDPLWTGERAEVLVRAELDYMAEQCRAALEVAFPQAQGGWEAQVVTDAREVLRVVSRVLFEDMPRPLEPASEYYSADNSFLDQVLRKRHGLPITLSIVYLAVARRLGLTALKPIGAPGHFVVGYFADAGGAPSRDAFFFVDPFQLGIVQSFEEMRDSPRFAQYGNALRQYLTPAPHTSIWVRVMNNMMGVLVREPANAPRALWVGACQLLLAQSGVEGVSELSLHKTHLQLMDALSSEPGSDFYFAALYSDGLQQSQQQSLRYLASHGFASLAGDVERLCEEQRKCTASTPKCRRALGPDGVPRKYCVIATRAVQFPVGTIMRHRRYEYRLGAYTTHAHAHQQIVFTSVHIGIHAYICA
jgi:regulator of sirC expression with transglutaminase-like and TPR domain